MSFCGLSRLILSPAATYLLKLPDAAISFTMKAVRRGNSSGAPRLNEHEPASRESHKQQFDGTSNLGSAAADYGRGFCRVPRDRNGYAGSATARPSRAWVWNIHRRPCG